MILSSVLLPQPLGPTMDTKFPASISKETLSSAVTVLAPPAKTLETSSTAISGGTSEPERMNNIVYRLINWLVKASFAVTFRPISKNSLTIFMVFSVISGLM
jgi:hypothetical protein